MGTQARLVRHSRRGHPEHILRLPRRRRAGRPAWEHAPLAGGGSIRSQRSRSPDSRSGRASRAGMARPAAAPPANSPRSRAHRPGLRSARRVCRSLRTDREGVLVSPSPTVRESVVVVVVVVLVLGGLEARLVPTVAAPTSTRVVDLFSATYRQTCR